MPKYVKTGKKRGPLSKYPWAEWFDKPLPFTLEKGHDYHCDTATFRQSVRSEANRRGLRVSIRTISDEAFEVTVIR